MTKKLSSIYERQINQLCYEGEKVIDSESFRGLKFLIKDNHIILISANNGCFSVRMDVLPDLFKELQDVVEIWGDIKTKKCLV